MPRASTLPAVSPLSTNELWRSIEQFVSEACVLRAEGREAEAIVIVQQTLPPLVAQWSRGAGMATEQCQQALRELFARVQQQVATAAICKRLVLQSVEAGATDRVTPGARFQIHRRVPLDDIPAMLDALDEGERAATFRRQYFPSHAARSQPALAVG